MIMRLLSLVFLLLSFSANAEWQGEFGQCRFTQADNGTFYQSDPGLVYNNYMTPRCGQIGWANKFKDSDWGYRIAAVKTGSIEIRGNYVAAGDGDYSGMRDPCDPKTLLGCHALMNGSGHTYGVSLSATREYRYDQLRIIPEAGLLFYRHTFHADIEFVEGQPGLKGSYDEASNWTGVPALLLGLSFKVGNIKAVVRHYDTTILGYRRELSVTNHTFTFLGMGVDL